MTSLENQFDVTPIQGPNSKKVKFDKNLCSDCNDKRSANWDKAYVQLMNYLYRNESIVKYKIVSLYNIWPKDHITKQRNNAFLYFIKHFGCALHERAKKLNLTFPQNLSKTLMTDKNLPCGLNISISHSNYWKPDFTDAMTTLQTSLTFNDNTKEIVSANGFEQFENLNIQYWFNEKANPTLGEPWNGKKNVIKLGIHKL